MDVKDIIAQSRIQTNTSTGQADDDQMVERLNIVWKGLRATLSAKSKKYAWTFYTASDLVSGQSEYTLPIEDQLDGVNKLKRLLKVKVRYGDKFVDAKIYNDTPADKNYSENSPYVFQGDGSVFLYPTPKNDVVEGLVLEGAYIPFPLDKTDRDIKLDQEYVDILIYGLNKRAFASKQLFDKEEIMRQKYEMRLSQMLQEGAYDMDGVYHEQLPDLSCFE